MEIYTEKKLYKNLFFYKKMAFEALGIQPELIKAIEDMDWMYFIIK